jgi:hypothetical protein
MVRFRWNALIGLCVMMLVAHARPASAQKQAPPGPFAIDVRGAFAGYTPTSVSAAPFGLQKGQMPARGLGIDLGAHVYPLRTKRITLGIGGNWLTSRGNKVPDPLVLPHDPTTREKFEAFSGQLSLNFGSSEGWSYISGGIGTSRRSIQKFPVITTTGADGKATTTQSDEPLTAKGARSKTINYGGGARWFASSHVAFGFDLRWYAVGPSVSSETVPALPRQTLFVANAGISIH